MTDAELEAYAARQHELLVAVVKSYLKLTIAVEPLIRACADPIALIVFTGQLKRIGDEVAALAKEGRELH